MLGPYLDSGVSIGDFTPDEYTGKLNPLNDESIVVEDVFFPSHGEKCHAWLYTSGSPTSSGGGNSPENTEEPNNENAPLVIMAPGLGTQKDFGMDRYAESFVQAGMSMFLPARGIDGKVEPSKGVFDV